jgi:Xaa-Pro aminopeptidase
MDDNDLGRLVEIKISDAELQRRWKAVRKAMEAQKLDFLIMQNCTDILGGYVKWFIDWPASINYPVTVIFPRNEDMTTICHGPEPPLPPNPPAWVLRGVKKRISTSALPSLHFADNFEPQKVVEELAPYKKCRIGWVGMAHIPASLYKYATEHLTAAEFTDATELVDVIKVIKSDEEISLIKKTCEQQDIAFEYALTRIQPGRRDYEVYADVFHKCLDLGSTQANIMIGSAPHDKAAKHLPKIYGNRRIQQGDQVAVLIEANGPAGLYGEFFRTVCLGKIPPALEEQFEQVKQAQQNIVNMLKPGIEPDDIFDAHNDFLKKIGYTPETRLLGHGQGYDMVERPSMGHGEPMKLQARMNIAVHPTVGSDKAYAQLCDNYIIKETGEAEWLSRIPKKVFVI